MKKLKATNQSLKYAKIIILGEIYKNKAENLAGDKSYFNKTGSYKRNLIL